MKEYKVKYRAEHKDYIILIKRKHGFLFWKSEKWEPYEIGYAYDGWMSGNEYTYSIASFKKEKDLIRFANDKGWKYVNSI